MAQRKHRAFGWLADRAADLFRGPSPLRLKKRGASPSPIVHATPLIQTLSEWELEDVLAAVESHERGEFEQSGLLWQWCQRDDKLKTVLLSRVSGLPRLPFTVETAGVDPLGEASATPREPTDLEKQAQAALKSRWFECFPESDTKAILRCSVGMGFALAQIRWVAIKGLWWPRLVLWPADAVRYDDAQRTWLAKTLDGEEIVVTPGDGTWFLYLPDGPRSFQLGGVIGLALPCLITSYSWKDWVNYNEANGAVLRKAIVPRGATRSEKDTYLANLAALGRATNTILCQRNLDGSGFDFELLEPPSGKAVDTFERSIDKAHKAKAGIVVGQTLTSDVGDSGSRALGDVHKEVKQEILSADAETFSTQLRAQVLRWWALYNFGSADVAPWPRWKHQPEADRAADANTTRTVGYVLGALRQGLAGTGYKLKIKPFCDRFGIEVEEGEDIPPAKDGGGDAGAADAQA